MKKLILFINLFYGLLFVRFSSAEVVFHHSMEGFLEVELKNVVENFHKLHPDIHIQLVFNGNYTQSFQKFMTLEDKKTLPNLLMVSEYNTVTMAKSRRYISLKELLSDFNVENIVPAIRSFYTFDSELLSLPFNSSVPAMYFNLDAFKQLGIEESHLPKTWEDLDYVLPLLKEKGYGLSSAWLVAYLLENYAAVNDLELLRKNKRGQWFFPLVDNPELKNQMNRFKRWQEKGYFIPAGKIASDAEKMFVERKAAIFFQGANRYGLLLNATKDKFSLKIAPYPYSKNLMRTPFAPAIGGASLWVVNIFDEANRQEIRTFLKYLSNAEVQAKWHQRTSYMPTTLEAFKLTQLEEEGNYYQNHPAHAVIKDQVLNRMPSHASLGVRIENYGPVREKLLQFVEEFLSGEKELENFSLGI